MSEEDAVAAQRAEKADDEWPMLSGDWLDRLTKLGALSFGLVYATGFIVVNAYYSEFGMADFSLFKAKILAAGCIFILLAMLPIVLTVRTYGLFGLRANRASIQSPPLPPTINNLAFVLGLYTGALILLNVTGFLFVNSFKLFGANRTIGLLLLGMWGAIVIAGHFWGYKYPKTYICLDALGMLAVMVTLARADVLDFLRSIWFYSWELLAVWVIKRLDKDLFWKSFEWERYVWVPITLIATFGLFMYGQVYARFGGGCPSKVLIYVNPDAKAIGSSPMTAWLIDEAEHGYYFLRSAHASRAVYLPREMVRGLEFVSADTENDIPKKNE